MRIAPPAVNHVAWPLVWTCSHFCFLICWEVYVKVVWDCWETTLYYVAMLINLTRYYGCSGLVVTCCERTQVWIWLRVVVLIVMATVIYSLRHGLHTLAAVFRSTQLSTLRVAVKWVSAFVLSNNKWRWWMWIVAASGLAVQVVPSWSTLSKGRLLLVLSSELDYLSLLWWQHHKCPARYL